MEKIDARKLKQEVQQALRDQVIRLRKQGKKNKDVAEFLGISSQHSSTLWQKYVQGGKKEILLGTRGRRHGDKRTLSEEQERHIQKLIVDKTPDQLKFPFALWTRDAVRELIGRQYGTTMPIRTVGEYLKRWGFTPQKPVKRAREQNPKAVEKWLKEEYPKIAAMAKKEKAMVRKAATYLLVRRTSPKSNFKNNRMALFSGKFPKAESRCLLLKRTSRKSSAGRL